MSFGAMNAPQTVTIPVPDGIRPTSLTGQLEPAVNVVDGYVEVQRSDGQIVGAVPVPAADTPLQATPFAIDISAVPVQDRAAVIKVVLRSAGGDQVCGPIPQLTLSNLAVTFAGGQALPTTVEQFFPSILPNAVVYVDPAPTLAEKQAALGLVAALTNHYSPIPIDVSVRTLGRNAEPPQVAFDNFSRTIVVRDSAAGAITLNPNGGAPYLAITGENDALAKQVEVFASGLLSLAQVPSVAVDSVDASSVQGSNTVMFEHFSKNLRVQALGQATLYTGFDPAVFALSDPGAVDVDLRAIYTPVQKSEKATVLMQADGQTIYSAPLGTSGRLHAQFTIPAQRVASSAELAIVVSYEPAPGACNPRTVPLTFEVEPNSTATAHTRDGAVGGFSALPLAWAPTFQVATDDSDPRALSHAADMVAAVQRMSPEILRPIIVGLDEAAHSGSGALIVASAESVNAAGLHPPIDAVGETTTIDVPAAIVAQIPSGLGSIQAYAQGDRTLVLVTTSGDWALVDPLFGYLDSLEGGVGNLTGDVLAAGLGGVPTVLTVHSDGLEASAPDVGDGWAVWVWVAVAVGIGVAATAGVLLIVRRRRTAGADPTTADHDS